MNLDRKFLVCALFYAILGMSLGIFMAASNDHGQHVTHAHVLLAGFVVSFIYATIHKLWLGAKAGGLATAQFVLHQAGVIVMITGLFLLFGSVFPPPQLEPFLIASSCAVWLGALLMFYLVIRAGRTGA
jgi:hypothetical protein